MTENYGIKISQDGYDVKNTNDENLVFSTKFGTYPSMCVGLSGTASYETVSNFEDIVFTINHSFQSTPFCLVYYQNGDTPNNWQLFGTSPEVILGDNSPTPTFVDFYDDKIVVKFSGFSTGESVTIRYYIFNIFV